MTPKDVPDPHLENMFPKYGGNRRFVSLMATYEEYITPKRWSIFIAIGKICTKFWSFYKIFLAISKKHSRFTPVFISFM